MGEILGSAEASGGQLKLWALAPEQTPMVYVRGAFCSLLAGRIRWRYCMVRDVIWGISWVRPENQRDTGRWRWNGSR